MERILSKKPLVSSSLLPSNIQEQRRSLSSSQQLSNQAPSLQEKKHFDISSSLFLQRVRAITSPPPPPPPPPPPKAPSEEDLLENQNKTTLFLVLIGFLDPQLSPVFERILRLLEQEYPDLLLHTIFSFLDPEFYMYEPDVIALDLYDAVLYVISRVFPRASMPAFLRAIYIDLYNGGTTTTLTCSDYYMRNSNPEDVSEESWDVLNLKLVQWLESTNEKVQEFAIILIGKLLRWGANERFALRAFNEFVCDTIKRKLSSDDVSLAVKENLVKASSAYILHLLKHGFPNSSQDLLRTVMNTVFMDGEIKFDTTQGRYAQVVIQGLSEVAEVSTEVLMDQIDEILEFMYTIREDSETNQETMFLVTKFLEILGSEKLLYGISFVQSRILKILASLEADKEEESSEYGQAMNELDRLVTNMGGLVLDSLFTSGFSTNLWKRSHCALTLLSTVAKKGSKKLPKLMLVVIPLLRFLKDIDPNVRRKAIIAIQDMCNQFNPEFQNLYHANVVPDLTNIMSDFWNPQIQVEAVRAVLYFAENCTSDILAPHLDKIISTLLGCLQRGDSDMQELVLEVIASIASSSPQRAMGQHYGRVMIHIKMMICDVRTVQNRQLLAAMIECITKLWKTVGKEQFRDDTGKVMELLSSLHELDPKPDNLRKTVLQAWGTICICLGKNFLPCTTVVIRHLLESARLDPDMSIPEDPHNEESHASYEKKVSCKLMEEKAEACTVLGIFAAELKEDFASWVPEVVDILVPLFGIDHPQVVRAAALKAVKPVLESYKVAEAKRIGVYEWYQNSRHQELFSCVESAKRKASDDMRLTTK